MKKTFLFIFLAIFMAGISSETLAQGTTSSAIYGSVIDNNGQPLPGATVLATHLPSGTTYGTSTRVNGDFNLPGLRVGGPYKIVVTFIGYTNLEMRDVHLELGLSTEFNFTLTEEALQLGDVTITADRDAIIRSDRTGTSTSISRENIATLPTISRRMEDLTRLTPQAGRRSSFGGIDNRMNNITIDGSYFNNSFGLGGLPGDRTGVAPISLDAIEQIQVNISPFDVRFGNFVGASINSVTRSGTNEFEGSVYYQYRNNDYVGDQAKEIAFNPGTFRFNQYGLRLGGPIIPNKLFFFVNFEDDKIIQPATTFIANQGGVPVGGNVTRVLARQLDSLSNFLRSNFGYETGPYEGYDFETPSTRFLMKLDYNLDPSNKISLRYTHLDSFTDVILSNSSSLGFGTRRTVTDALNFANSNYQIKENIRSVVGEWNSIISNTMSNNMIIGYTFNDESRASKGSFFPFVDILEGGSVYTSFGFEPFTPSNELRYKSFQFQNNLSIFLKKHNITVGVSVERYESENIFFPGSQSVYVYNSLSDFYRDAQGFIANPARDTSTVTLRRFQVRWSNIPGQDKPIQPLKVWYSGVYAQNQWQVLENLNVIAGLRLDVPIFENTGFRNAQLDTMFFRDEAGQRVQYQTDKLPDPSFLISPRVGINWDIFNDKAAQLRGGTGIFTGRPAYVWISNQIGNNGVMTGFERLDNTRRRPFNPDPNRYKPTNVTGAPASAYELALTDPDFKFVQMWRSNIGVDVKLPFDFVISAEYLYSRDVNGVYYINANLREANTAFNGIDNRPRWTGSNRINANIDNAIVLKNEDKGYYWSATLSLEKPFSNNWYFKSGYNYGEAKNTVDPGSIAFGSWNNNQHSGNPNNPGVGFSALSPGHRLFGMFTYRLNYFDFGSTALTLFVDGFTQGNASYTFAGDLNGDGGTSNDLIYIPRDASEMNFEQYSVTLSGVTTTFTAQQQIDAWEAFIKQDEYLSENRGKYAERNAAFLPMVFRADLSLVQEFAVNFMSKKNTLQFRIDILNFTNLVNNDWGVGDVFTTTQPLIARPTPADGKALYRLRNVGDKLISTTFQQSANIDDVYRIQVGIRYIFE